MEPLIGQIVLFAGNFAPQGWALCDGQLLAVSQNTALFSILGTTYGGDGRTTFALPDLRGRVPVHAGGGAGLTQRVLGEKSGAEGVALTQEQMPAHNHLVNCTDARGQTNTPSGNYPGSHPDNPYSSDMPDAVMNARMISETGGNQPHDNMQPYVAVNFIIALVGVFPSRK